MPGRSIELLAAGPCPADPYDPTSAPWALAAGIAAWGDRVRVLHPPGPVPGTPPSGVEELVVDLPLRRPGAAVEEAAFAEAAARRLRPDAQIVVRDPLGLGRLRPGKRRDDLTVVGIVRGVERLTLDRNASERRSGGFLGRVDLWRDRRAVGRLEAEAIDEAERLFYADPDLPEILKREYGVDPRRLSEAPTAVLGGERPSRAAARAALRLPLDVLVVAAPLASDDPAAPEAKAAREAFRRARSLFAGVRLVAVGAPSPGAEPGSTWDADRSVAAYERALAAADIAIVAPERPGFDPGAALALRAGCPLLASPHLRLPGAPDGAVRLAATPEPADLAAALAELLADPEQRRHLREAGTRFGERFEPERVAAVVTAERRLVAA